uniref:ATP synthase F0 subunit 8 n=1 Tax=Lampsilis siliquoidea TaxID=52396 RepID=A0A2U7Q100_LAMSI|nr:ATP synthase F0 subunit 8 [Lampsilis siliquoidea]AUF70018.1 ATP synthase F0 subunit 8 [Lampsilis siliquoidea]
MPQLSPMSWILVFGILLVCVILFMVIIWWGVVTEYKIMYKSKIGSTVMGVGNFVVKWGFGKKLSSNKQNKLS